MQSCNGERNIIVMSMVMRPNDETLEKYAAKYEETGDDAYAVEDSEYSCMIRLKKEDLDAFWDGKDVLPLYSMDFGCEDGHDSWGGRHGNTQAIDCGRGEPTVSVSYMTQEEWDDFSKGFSWGKSKECVIFKDYDDIGVSVTVASPDDDMPVKCGASISSDILDIERMAQSFEGKNNQQGAPS